MNVSDLHDAFVRCTRRRIFTANEANEHLRANGWDDRWEAFKASPVGNWYSFLAALKGKPGHQKTLKGILSLPPRIKEAAQ